ncbi:MAG TPA: HAMP domain-containing histidine kinase, partial [Saprospiraceae bacterium]|nr:HAMP domain-containing histidine kinase [Saprospiraceae bacterium]
MKNSTILRVILLGAFAILSIIVVQTYWITKSWKLNEKEFHQKVILSLSNVAEELANLSNGDLPAEDLIKRVDPNYYIVNVNNSFSPEILEFLLKKEFNEAALNEDFEYGIYDCETDKMISGKYVALSSQIETTKPITEELKTDDNFVYYFGVRFPHNERYILDSMALPIIFSALLFLSIIFFIYSISVILRQKRLSEMQKDFINNMTHEFKTPISTINISSDVLLRTPSIQEDKRLQQYASIIKEQNNRLNKQVEKVLQFARIEKKDFKLKLEKIDLNELLQNIAYSAQLRVDESNGHFDLKLCKEHVFVEADRLHLTNILHNLLDNAIKYSKDTPEIGLAAKKVGNTIEIEISDKGIGIPV